MANNDFLCELGWTSFATRLKRLSDAMMHDGRRFYKRMGLDIEPNWYAFFMLLRKHPRLTITEIGDRLGMSHPSVISIVNGMAKAGYLDEARCDEDNRKRRLTLSKKALQKLPEYEKMWEAGTASYKHLAEGLPVADVLDALEERLFAKGFMERASEEIARQKEVEIREFRREYARDFAEMNYEWIAESYTIEEHDREVLDHAEKVIIKPGGQIFFAAVEGVNVGTVALIQMAGDAFELAKMAVRPANRGYRIADKLMRTCIDYSRKAGKKRIILESNTKQAAAIKLYRKFGFVEIPLDPNSHFERANIRMELVLD